MCNLVRSPGFALADLACAILAGTWWVLIPQTGPWPLGIALLPWVIRLAAKKFPFQRTTLDIPILIFLLTAGVGVWAAYDRAAAWGKFWLIVAAVLLYYALAEQPRPNGSLVAGLASMLGVSLSIYFLLTNDWKLFPADLNILNRLGIAWMKVRPGVHASIIQPNIAGGVLAMLLPFDLALGLDAWHKRNRWLLLAATGFSGIVAMGLLMTSSRAAWTALIAGLGVWCWWYVSGFVARRLVHNRILTFGLPILLAVVLAFVAFGLRSSSLIRVANVVPGKADAGSRVEITRNTIQLIRDFPFTGGGLASFPGLYSIYMRVIQVPEFFYSHNLYMDVALEQGLPGLAVFLILMAGAVWLAIKSLAANLLRNHLAGASLAALAVVLLHGFLDDALYGMGGTSLIFLVPGIVVSLQIADERAPASKDRILTSRKFVSPLFVWGVGGVLVLLGVAGAVFAKPLISAWYANMGSVTMAWSQLPVWPDSLKEQPAKQPLVDASSDLFYKALKQNPDNPTALYRLGIIAYNKNDFDTARDYLVSAYTHNPDHRGIQKLLGYTYTWTDDTLKAKALLIMIPEAGYEMSVYTWWWETHDRPDLSKLANQIAVQLQPQ